MEKSDLKPIVSWIINREFNKEDNKHIKKACKERDKVLKITNYDKEDLIEFCINDLLKMNIDKYIKKSMKNGIGVFPYIASTIYKTLLPSLIEGYKLAEPLWNKSGG